MLPSGAMPTLCTGAARSISLISIPTGSLAASSGNFLGGCASPAMKRSGSRLNPVTRSTPSIAMIRNISEPITSTGSPGPARPSRPDPAAQAGRRLGGSGAAVGSGVVTLAVPTCAATRASRPAATTSPRQAR
ncbi:hypothetical protein GCM10029963_61710 [Micromonospora andamanensis]